MHDEYTHLFAVIDGGSLVIEGHSNINETVDLLTVDPELAGDESGRISAFAYDHRFTPFFYSTEADLSPFSIVLERIARAVHATINHAA